MTWLPPNMIRRRLDGSWPLRSEADDPDASVFWLDTATSDKDMGEPIPSEIREGDKWGRWF